MLIKGQLFKGHEIAAAFNVRKDTVSDWIRRGLIPEQSSANSKLFHIHKVHQWLLEQKMDQKRKKDQSYRDNRGIEGSTDSELKSKKLLAETEKLVVEAALMTRKAIDVEEAADIFSESFSNFRAKALSMPSKLAPVLATDDDIDNIKAVLKDSLDEALNELSGGYERLKNYSEQI
jgi:hypothetical protein